MKTKLRQLLALFATSSSLLAAPLASTTAIHTRPDAASPAVGVLNAGTEPALAGDAPLVLPPGWQAVEIAGPHEVYVHGKDLTKNLDIKPGAELHTLPRADSPVLTTMMPGDVVSITGLHGRWTQIKLEKKIIGYIRNANAANTAPVAASAPAASSSPAPAAAWSSTANAGTPEPSPAPASALPDGVSGRPAQKSATMNDGGASALPRLFKGQLVASRKLLGLGRSPYAFQLNDDGGQRYAYLDTSKLLLTEQVDKYIDHTVVVYGTAKPVPNSKDIVIQVESLQLQ
jgi:hypothetical protein